MNESYLDKFHLDKTSKKYMCPQCGKKRMVVYVHADTLEPVNEYAFGRCDREAECSYHTKPEIQKKAKSTAIKRQIFPDDSRLKTMHKKPTGFHKHILAQAGITHAQLYEMGILQTTIRDKATGGDIELTVYVFRNQAGALVNFKWFRYKEDGKRDHDFDSFSLKQPESDNEYVQDYYGMCLFLEQFLDPERKRAVCIVESEKTAAICRVAYPQYDWVGCGSANGLSDGSEGSSDKITPLKGRECFWLCDADAAGRGKYVEQRKGEPESKEWVWPSSVRNLVKHIEKVHVVDLFPNRNDGYDIGDAVLNGDRPSIVPTWTKGKNKPTELHDKRAASLVVMDVDAMLYEFRNGKLVGESARIPVLSENFSWKRGFVNCWTGWPNDGKTTFFQFMALMKSLVDKWKWCIWPPEMLNTQRDSNGKIKTSASDIWDELVYMYTGRCPYKHYKALYGIPQMYEAEYLKAIDELKDFFIIINPKDRKYDDLLDNFRYFHDIYNFDAALIDPFKNLNHNENDQRFDLYLDKVFSESKELSLERDISMNYIAHPKNQVDPKNTDGSYKICSQFMLAGGAAWNNNMDGIYSIYRPFKHDKPTDPRVTFLNLKQRKQQLVGRVGKYDKIEMLFSTNRYYFDGHCPIDGSYNEPMYKAIEQAKEAKTEKGQRKKSVQNAAKEMEITFDDAGLKDDNIVPPPHVEGDEHTPIF